MHWHHGDALTDVVLQLPVYNVHRDREIEKLKTWSQLELIIVRIHSQQP